MRSAKIKRSVVVGVTFAVAIGALGGCGGSANSTSSATPTTSASVLNGNNAQDKAFIEAMIPHHEQAVAMAGMVPSHTQNAQIRALAAQIEAAQGPEITKMQSWLGEWNEADMPNSGAHSSDAMDHGSGDGSMSGMDGGTSSMHAEGMMTDEQMSQLAKARGAAFDKLWLQDMIAHHQGAVAMAQQELAAGENPQVKALAQAVIDGQNKEIARMQQMLA